MPEINLNADINKLLEINGNLSNELNISGAIGNSAELFGGDISEDKTKILEGEISQISSLSGDIQTQIELSCDILYNTLKPVVDTELSSTSINPIANKTVYEALQNFVPNPDNVDVSIEIGSVETVDSEENASIVNSGTKTNAVFDFKIPRGKDGDTPYIGSNGNWFVEDIDTGKLATVEGISNEITQILDLFEGGKFAHTITIGEHVYNGTEDVIIDIYKGELSNEEINSLLYLIQEELTPMQLDDASNNSMQLDDASNNSMQLDDASNNSMQLDGASNNSMQLNSNVNAMTMNGSINTMFLIS